MAPLWLCNHLPVSCKAYYVYNLFMIVSEKNAVCMILSTATCTSYTSRPWHHYDYVTICQWAAKHTMYITYLWLSVRITQCAWFYLQLHVHLTCVNNALTLQQWIRHELVANCGQPKTILICFWKELLMVSDWKVSMMSLLNFPPCLVEQLAWRMWKSIVECLRNCAYRRCLNCVPGYTPASIHHIITSISPCMYMPLLNTVLSRGYKPLVLSKLKHSVFGPYTYYTLKMLSTTISPKMYCT